MPATEILMSEHSTILDVLQILKKLCRRMESDREVATADLQEVLQFFIIFADRCHHAKEERALFPAMVDAGLPSEHGPIGVMLNEHTQGREYVGRMTEALQNLMSGHPEAKIAFIDISRRYIAHLEQHISKENDVLFRIAEAILPAERMVHLTEAFDRIESENIDQDVHERFHLMIKRLQSALT